MDTAHTVRHSSLGGLAILIMGMTRFVAAADAPAAPASGAPASAGAMGTLEFGERMYYPQGCSHNGNTAVCTFVLVNQGEPATLNAWVGELRGVQFVDDGHVPHNPNRGYFIDKYGSRQPQLLVQKGDQGTLVLEFASVDPRVGTGEFHLGTQIIGGVPMNQPAYAPPGSANTLSAGNGTAQGTAPAAAKSAGPTQQQPVCTAQNANTPACKLQKFQQKWGLPLPSH